MMTLCCWTRALIGDEQFLYPAIPTCGHFHNIISCSKSRRGRTPLICLRCSNWEQVKGGSARGEGLCVTRCRTVLRRVALRNGCCLSSVCFYMTYWIDRAILIRLLCFNGSTCLIGFNYTWWWLSDLIFQASILPHSSPTSHDVCFSNDKSSVSPGNETMTVTTQMWRNKTTLVAERGEHTKTHTLEMLAHAHMHIHNRTMKSLSKIHLSLNCSTTHLDSLHTSQRPPSHCVLKASQRGLHTGAKILRDQLINAIFKARIYMSRD